MTDFPFSTSDTQGVEKILTPPLPLPYMGGEYLRTTLSLPSKSCFPTPGKGCPKLSQVVFPHKKLQISNFKHQKMKKPLWKTIIDVVIVILTSIVTTVGTTSCMRGGF